MSTNDINPHIYQIDANERKIPIIEGSCEKYCITTGYEEKKHYCKFSKFDEVFAEVFTSHILGESGFPTVPYMFVVEDSDDKKRIGTISDDFSEGAVYRASLDSMAEKTEMINPKDFTEHIYINLPKAMDVIEKFCRMHHIRFNEQDRQQIQTQLECQIIIDYCFCNSDHHLKNTEFLIYSEKGERVIKLAPMFDLGQSLRGANVEMAFTFSDLSKEGAELSSNGRTKADMYADHILRYFKEKHRSPKDLANDYSFRLLYYFQDLNTGAEMIKFLCSCSETYKYYKNNNLHQKDEEDFYYLVNMLVEDLKNSLGTKENLSWVSMKDAFETRLMLLFDGLAKDDFFKEALEHVKPINYNPPVETSESEKSY